MGTIGGRLQKTIRVSNFSKVFYAALPALIIVTGLLMTGWGSWYVYTNGAEKDKLSFEARTTELRCQIIGFFKSYETMLFSARGMMESHGGRITADDFHRYTDNIQLDEKFGGVQGLGYVKFYRNRSIDAITRDIESMGGGRVEITPSEPRPGIGPIVFLEPRTERNRAALGYDMFSESVRRVAMERARDTGLLSMSGKVTLKQEIDENVQPGFLLYVPIYSQPINPSTVDVRRQQLLGYVYSPFRASNFFKSLVGAVEPKIDFAVYDGTDVNPSNLLYELQTNSLYQAGLTSEEQLELAGQTWTIVYANRAASEITSERYLALFVCIFGIGLTLFLFAAVRTQIAGRVAAEQSELALMKSQMALQASEERMRMLIEGAKEYAIIMLDQAGRITSWNVGAQQLFGYFEREIVDRSYALFFPAESRKQAQPRRELQRAVKNGNVAFERRFVKKDGASFWVSGVINAIIDYQGQLKGFAMIARDVTARRTAEEKLRHNEALTKSILSSLTAHIAVLDRLGKIIATNVEWEKITFPTLIGNVVPLVHGDNYLEAVRYSQRPDDEYARKAAQGIELVLHGKLTHFTFQYPAAFGESEQAEWYEMHVTPLKYERGGVVLSHTNITNRKKLEQQKDEFISIASHELKTPITSIKAYTQVMQRLLTAAANSRAAQVLNKMDTQLDKVTTLINDLLDVSKIEAGRLELKIEEFEYRQLVKEVIETVQLTSDSHQLLLRYGKPVTIEGDRDRIGQVLMNLLTNAIKYSPKASKVIITIEMSGESIHTAVQDFGIGIAQDEQETIFERFFRASSPRSRTFPGLGLGLYVSAEIVQRLRGRIWVESTIGEGSTFYVELPLRQSP